LNGVGTITYYAEYNDGTCSSLTRTGVTLTITGAPTAPIATSSSITECEESPIQTLDANTGLSSTTGITWYDAASGGNVVVNPTLSAVGDTTYYAEFSDGTCSSLTRTDVTLTITGAPTAPTATSSSMTECEESPIQTLDANTGLSSTTGVTWYDSSSGGNVVASPTLSAVGTATYYAEFSNGTCSSLTRTGVTLTIIDSPDNPAADVDQSFCKNTNPELSDINVVGQSIQYYDSNQNILPSSTLLVDGETYYVTQTVGGCESFSNFAITVHLDSLELNLLTVTSTFCNASNGSAQVIADNGYPSYSYLWENGTQSSIITGLSEGEYLVTVTDSLGCQSNLMVTINCTKHPIPEFVSVGGSGSGSGSSGNTSWETNLPPEAEVQIFNRWGNLIFKACPYLDDFNGKSNQGGTLGDDYLPSGTYFYVIDYKNGEKPVSGYIEFVR
jgi:hypothetical protein